MNERKIRVAVVGVGSLGRAHARIYSQLPEAELVGVYDVDSRRAQEVAAEYRTAALASLDEVAQRAEAASVVVPTDRHHPVASVLLDRGLHLLVEKPLAANTEEAEDLVARAQKRGVILQVGHVERFNPVLSFLDGLHRPPRFIEAHRLAPYPPPRPGLPPRGTEVNVILDLMIHDLEVILYLVGSPVKDIRAVGVPVLSPTEDIANVRLTFENGCIANITASRVSPERMRKIRAFYDDMYISLDYQKQAGEMYRKIVGGIVREEIQVRKEEPLLLELRSFLQCVQRRDRPVVSAEHAAEALKLAVAITRQIREHPS